MHFVTILAAMAVASSAFAAPLDDRTDATVLPLDRPTDIGGVSLACTGIGETRNDPQWRDYSVRIEVSNARSEYLAGEQVTVRGMHGAELFTVSCDDPWVLADLPPGSYVVEARLHGNPDAEVRTATIRAPARGQIRVVLQFPDAD